MIKYDKDDFTNYSIRWDKDTSHKCGGVAYRGDEDHPELYAKWKYIDNQLYKRCKKCKQYKPIQDYKCEIENETHNAIYLSYNYYDCFKCRGY